jgi:peroxiredoxin Q/BCP
MAPDFQLVGTDGKTYKLSDFVGKQAVVIAWYPKAFTGGWTRECLSFRENGQLLRQFDVAYFTASCDSPEDNQRFAKSLELDYVILSDPDGKVATAYGIYNPERKLAARVTFIIGKDGKIAHIDDKVNVQNHAKDIAAVLESLGVPKKSQ